MPKFIDILKELFTSKKFLALAATGIVWVVARLGFEVDQQQIDRLLAFVAAYIIGQGIADRGKGAAVAVARIDRENRAAGLTSPSAALQVTSPYGSPVVPERTPDDLARRTIIGLLLIVFFVVGCGGSQGGRTGQTIIDCTKLSAEKLGNLELEMLPLLGGQRPNWTAVEAKAIDAGVELGGCVLANLVQNFLGGRKAVPNDQSWIAHETLERFRTQRAGGATFRTAQGDL